MNKIELGKATTGKTIYFGFQPYETRNILVQGISGSRKSSLLEEIMKRFTKISPKPNQIIIDVEGEFARLRKYHDYIIIGNEGEIPIDLNYAEMLGRQVREQNLDMIIQLDSLEHEVEREEFIASFIHGMLNVEKKFWTPCIYMQDEIQTHCSNAKATSSRDALVQLSQTGRKRGILCLVASQSIKDFYKNARIEYDNRIVGYTHDATDRKQALELLMMDEQNDRIFLELDNEPKGRFYAWGSSIIKPATMFQLESIAYTQAEKFQVPPSSQKILKQAQLLRNALRDIKVSDETFLKNRNKELEAMVENLKLTQINDINIERLTRESYLKGWKECDSRTLGIIRQIVEKKSWLDFLKKKEIMEVRIEKKPDGREELYLS